MIKAVIFDVGGVLVRTPDRQSRRIWEERLGLSERESEEIVFDSQMGVRAQMGEITDEELWIWVGQRLSLTPEVLAAFGNDFWAGDRLDTGLIAYIRSLRPQYQTAIISNATDRLRRSLKESYSIDGAFDLIVCSAEEHVMKPDAEIYLRTLAKLGRTPGETVFVDDSEANIAGADQLGMRTIHFTTATDVPSRLAELGVRPGGTK